MRARWGWVVALALAAVLVVWLGGVLDESAPPASSDQEGALEESSLRAADADLHAKTAPTLRGAGKEAGQPEPVEASAPRITGIVVDEGGAPVAGARIVSIPDLHRGVLTEAMIASGDLPGAATQSRADGRFAVGVGVDVPYHVLVATAAGHAPGIVPDAATGADVRIVLEPDASMTGVVKDTGGTPIPGAIVRGWVLVDALQIDVEATADSEGRYRVDGLPSRLAQEQAAWEGFFRVNWFEVRAEGYAPLLVEDVRPKASGRELTQDFTLSRGATLTGVVTDAESAEPISDAHVVLYSIEGLRGFGRQAGGGYSCPFAPRVVAETTSDDDGAYRIEHVPSRGSNPVASHNSSRGGGAALGGVLAWRAGYAARGARLSVPRDGEQIEQVLELWPSGQIKGRVLKTDGTPMTDVTVSLVVEGREFGASIPKGLSGVVPGTWDSELEPDGSFLITGAPAARGGPTDGKLTAYPRGPRRRSPVRWKNVERRITFGVGLTDVGDITLEEPERYTTTTLIVNQPDGAPFFGAYVTRGLMGNPPRTDVDGRVAWIWGVPTAERPHSPIEVLVRARGYAPTTATLHPPGSGRETVTVTLPPAQRIAGRVLHADGEPAIDVTVNVGDGALPVEDVFPSAWGASIFAGRGHGRTRAMPLIYATIKSDAEGRFEATELPQGPYHVVAALPRRVPRGPGDPGRRAIQSNVAAGDDRIELRLPPDDSPPTGMLTGSIDFGAAPIPPRIQMRVMRGDKTLAFIWGARAHAPNADYARIDESGVFVVPNLPVGPCELSIDAPGFLPRKVTGIDVREGATTEVPKIDLATGVTVSGRATAPDGIALEGHSLILQGDDTSESAPLAADGSFRISGLSAGTYAVVAQPVHWSAKSFPLVPAEGEPLILSGTSSEVSYHPTLVAGAWLVLSPDDARFPPGGPGGGKATDAQRTFGRASRVRVVGPDGQVIYEHEGIQRGWAGPRSWLALRPGRYAARLEMPAGEVREQTVELEARQRIEVHFETP